MNLRTATLILLAGLGLPALAAYPVAIKNTTWKPWFLRTRAVGYDLTVIHYTRAGQVRHLIPADSTGILIKLPARTTVALEGKMGPEDTPFRFNFTLCDHRWEEPAGDIITYTPVPGETTGSLEAHQAILFGAVAQDEVGLPASGIEIIAEDWRRALDGKMEYLDDAPSPASSEAGSLQSSPPSTPEKSAPGTPDSGAQTPDKTSPEKQEES